MMTMKMKMMMMTMMMMMMMKKKKKMMMMMMKMKKKMMMMMKKKKKMMMMKMMKMMMKMEVHYQDKSWNKVKQNKESNRSHTNVPSMVKQVITAGAVPISRLNQHLTTRIQVHTGWMCCLNRALVLLHLP